MTYRVVYMGQELKRPWEVRASSEALDARHPHGAAHVESQFTNRSQAQKDCDRRNSIHRQILPWDNTPTGSVPKEHPHGPYAVRRYLLSSGSLAPFELMEGPIDFKWYERYKGDLHPSNVPPGESAEESYQLIDSYALKHRWRRADRPVDPGFRDSNDPGKSMDNPVDMAKTHSNGLPIGRRKLVTHLAADWIGTADDVYRTGDPDFTSPEDQRKYGHEKRQWEIGFTLGAGKMAHRARVEAYSNVEAQRKAKQLKVVQGRGVMNILSVREIKVNPSGRISDYDRAQGFLGELYVGMKKGKGKVFKSIHPPTEESHGRIFDVVVGPFKTEDAAHLMAGRTGPSIQTVADAERYVAAHRKA